MGKRVTGETSEKKEDHPLENDVRNTNDDDGVTETSVNCSTATDEKNKVTGTSTTPPQPTMAEDAEEYIKPIIKDGEVILEVECGQNKALLYLSKLCQGSKGPCIYFQGSWLAPNEFQYVSGRETAKDWKRSIRHHGKSLKLLLAKGILSVHPTVCDCEGCRTGSTLNRNRNGTKKKIPTNKDGKSKQPTDGSKCISQDVDKSNLTTPAPGGEKIQKDVKRIKKKPSDKPVSPLRESKSTNIMNSTSGSSVQVAEERVPKVPVVVPCPVVTGPFQIPKIPVLSPVKPESLETGLASVPIRNDRQMKLEDTPGKLELTSNTNISPVKSTSDEYKSLEDKSTPSVHKSNTDVCKENVLNDKPSSESSSQETPKNVRHCKIESTKSSFDSPLSTEASRSPSHDIPRKIQDQESEKIIPKTVPGYVPRLGSEVPAFRLADTSTDAALYADYMRMFSPGHHLLPQVPQPIDPIFALRASDPSFNPVLHPYHGCAMYNPHPTGLYPRDTVLFPTTAGALPPSIGAQCFSPMHMISQRLPYTLSSPVMELPRPFGFMHTPSSMSYPCSGISGLKRHHSDLESASDFASKRLRLDYPIPEFRFDSYPSCSPSYPPLYYETALLQSEEYRRKRLEESMNCGKDIHSYIHPLMHKPGYQCTCVNRPGDIRNWTVEDVCAFISGLDGCSLYSEMFREQRVDGKILSLITTDHLMKSLGLKLGPAVLIAEAVAKQLHELRIVGCDGCRKLSLGISVEM